MRSRTVRSYNVVETLVLALLRGIMHWSVYNDDVIRSLGLRMRRPLRANACSSPALHSMRFPTHPPKSLFKAENSKPFLSLPSLPPSLFGTILQISPILL